MAQRFFSSALTAAATIGIVALEPHTASAQSVDRLRDVLTQIIEKKIDPEREPDWSGLREIVARSVREDPTSDIAVLAQRAAATVKVEISQPVSSLDTAASLGIEPRPRFQIEGLHYVVAVEGSLDGGAWRTVGWADYPDGGCGTVITKLFSRVELRPGLHRLDLRANFFLADPRDRHHTSFETPCGFLTPDGTPQYGQPLADFSGLKVLFQESRAAE